MKVALITEGTYPITTGGVSTWCDQIVRGLPEHQFSLVALTATGREPIRWPLPDNVTDANLHAVWGRIPRHPSWRNRSRAAGLARTRSALAELWDAVLAPDSEAAVAATDVALQKLVEISSQFGLGSVLAAESSVVPILDAWDDHLVPAGERPLSVSDAVAVANLVDRTLAVFDAEVPEVDIVHTSSNGLASLVGLAQLWRFGTPFALSEHGVYLRERYLALHDGGFSWPVRRVVTAFLRRVCEVVYRRAHLILPVNRFNRRWEERLGADPRRIYTIPNGVDPQIFRPVETEPQIPTVSFVGRIDPLKDLETLVSAFSRVRTVIPEARLRIFGPTPPRNIPYRDTVVAHCRQLGLTDAVSWEGPSNGSRPAIAAGHVVALSSISEGLPFTLIESMMCGRATVNTDVGGVAECLDDAHEAGALVPARDPDAFAGATLRLLEDRDARQHMAEAARERALALFTLQGCIDRYRTAYDATAHLRLLPRRLRTRTAASQPNLRIAS